MKILLANIPWEKDGKIGIRAGSRFPHIRNKVEECNYLSFPFFLAYAAALLKKNNFSVKLIDALAEGMGEKEFLDKLKNYRPDLIVVETSTVSLEDDISLISKIDSGSKIALCGPDINITRPEFLRINKKIDYVLRGEYEFTLLDLVERLNSKSDLKYLNGLNYRDSKGDIHINPDRPLIENLDELPWPLRESLPMDKYIDAPCGMPLPSVQMMASRGCLYGCNFCLWPQVMYREKKYRARNPKDVVDEMEWLVKEKRFKSIYFDDDTFNIGKIRILEICREIKKRNLNVPWAIMARADIMDREILKEMRSAGLFAVKYGIESGVQAIQEASGKYLNLDKAADIIHITKDLGIRVHLTFMFGLPGETKETIRETIDFALGLNPSSVQFSIATPFPGTKYFEELERKGLLVSKRWPDYDGNNRCVLRTEKLTAEELESARKKAYFYWSEHCKKRDACRYPILLYKLILSLKTFGPRYTLKKIHRCLKRIMGYYKLPRLYNMNDRNKLLVVRGILHSSQAFVGPEVLHIDLTNQCNFNCIACWNSSPLLGEKTKLEKERKLVLPLNLLKNVFDDLSEMKGLQHIKLQGGGEPFMHPDILKIVEYIKSKDKTIKIDINTNFSLIDEKIVEKLLELEVDSLTVSIWAGTPMVYSAVHPNQPERTFYKIRDMLKFIFERKKIMGRDSPKIVIHNVIFNLNYKEVEQMIRFALEIGAENIQFAPIDPVKGKTDILILNDKERKELLKKLYMIRNRYKPETCQYISEDCKSVVLADFDIFTRRIEKLDVTTGAYDEEIIEEIPCYVGWLFARIMTTGDVVPCCKAHRMPMGNIYKERFKDIWFSNVYREFRHNVLTLSKSNPYFSKIGHFSGSITGCHNCDNLWQNVSMHRNILHFKSKNFRLVSFFSSLPKHF